MSRCANWCNKGLLIKYVKACRYTDFGLRVRAQRRGKPTSWSRRAQCDSRSLSIKCVSHNAMPSQSYMVDFCLASLATLIVYSMSVDGPERSSNTNENSQETSFVAGSRALDSLAKIITSAESFFHPSNTGLWTLGVCPQY